MGRAVSNPKRTTLPRVRTEATVNADIRACPSPCRGCDIGWRCGDHRRRHLIARQSRQWRSEHDHFLRDIAKSATPRCTAPGTGASLQVDLRPLRDTLHHRRPATRPGAHGGWRSRHRQFGACRREKGYGKAKPKTKTRNHVALVGKDMVFNRRPHSLRLASWASSLAEIRLAKLRRRHDIFVARHVGPFGPNAGSMRKLSLAVIAPRGKASSGMTRVA
jgi:hypothetical protein